MSMFIVNKVRFLVSDVKEVTYLKQRAPLAWVLHLVWSWLLLDCTLFMTADDGPPHHGVVNFNIINWRFAKPHDVPDMVEHRRFLDSRLWWKRITG